MFALGAPHLVHSALTPEEAMAGLRHVTVPGGLFVFDRPAAGSPPLRGQIEGLRFSVVRRAQFRNSFTPIVEGVVVPAERGCQVQLQLGLHFVPAVTLLVWVLATLSLAVLAAQSEALGEMALMLVALTLIGPVVGAVAYRADVATVVDEIALAVNRPREG